ncbi:MULTISPECIES: hypothetical protein [unclassified Microcoleus]|uniref:hypothetical protein n=1 Tax=unclassified Microcoleus TaxID=2642155 RepID=UPI002FD4817A
MAWLTLGTLDMANLNSWNATELSAIDQDLIRLTYIATGPVSSIKSRLLIRRVWQVEGELPVEEKALIVYPSSNRILLNLPVLPDYLESGLATYKIQLKRYFRFYRAIIQESRYFIRVEVS